MAGAVLVVFVRGEGRRRCRAPGRSICRNESITRLSSPAPASEGTAAKARQDSTASGSMQPTVTAQRATRIAQYEQMKRDSFTDSAIVGLVGAVFAFLSSGIPAALGLVLGVVAGSLYLTLLHRDVDALSSRQTPLDMFNLLRIARLLVPLFLVLFLGVQTALSMGVDVWLEGLRWEPAKNFTGFVSPPLLYGALLGYILPTLTLQLRGLASAVPEVRDLVGALPGSVGVAVKYSQDADKRKASSQAKGPAAKVVPVLLVSGPRGCGKSTLVQRLTESDPRFSEPEWIATGGGSTSGAGSKHELVSEAEFKELQESGSLAVSYRPYDDDGETIDLGLPALAVLAAAAEKGACVLDVDPPTARTLLSYTWDRALATASPDEKLELRFVTVWVSLSTLDAVMERNRERLSASLGTASAVDRQVAPLRAQATSDIEWALTSGSFDFTVINEDRGKAEAEVIKAAKYCFDEA